MTYGEAIREAREARGWSLRDLGAALDLSVPYLSDIERGNRAPLGEVHEAALASALGLDAAAVARLRVLAAVARGTVDVRGLRPEAVARVLRAIERERKLANNALSVEDL